MSEPKSVIVKISKNGRPTKFKATMLEDAQNLSSIFCASYADFGKYWGVSKGTVFRWAQRHPEFRNAIERGKQMSKAVLQARLMKLAKEGNLGALVFVLTNKFPDDWKDRRAIVNNKIVAGVQVNNGDSETVTVKGIVKKWSPKMRSKFKAIAEAMSEEAEAK